MSIAFLVLTQGLLQYNKLSGRTNKIKVSSSIRPAIWVSHLAITPAKCRLGRVQRNPTKPGVGSTQPTKFNVAQDGTSANFRNEVSYETEHRMG